MFCRRVSQGLTNKGLFSRTEHSLLARTSLCRNVSTILVHLEYLKFLHVSRKWSLTLLWLRLGLSSATQLNVQQGYLSPTSMRWDWFCAICYSSNQCNIICGKERLAWLTAEVWKPPLTTRVKNTATDVSFLYILFLFFVLSYYFSKAMFWRNGDWCGRCKEVTSFNSLEPEHPQGHFSYFYHQENIGVGLGFRQLRILSSTVTRKSEGACTQTRNIPTTLQEPPFQN